MQLKSIVLFSTVFLSASFASDGQVSQDQLDYIEKYKAIAIQEMKRTGIPASITLAQGILESDAGRSDLARLANNHFGIKCGSNWNGPVYYKKDDDFDENNNLQNSCFRSYQSVATSFIDHSEFLRDPKKEYRYGSLFKLAPTDYRAWAYGLQKAGYATNVIYPTLLTNIIERYKLYNYDQPTGIPEEVSPADTPPVVTTNKVPNTKASGYETPKDIADRTDVPVEDILDFNDGLSNGIYLPSGKKIYLEPKRNNFKGPIKYHQVLEGETMTDIAQRYAVNLDRLRDRNRLGPLDQPAPGQFIKLSGGKVKIPPMLRNRSASSSTDSGFDPANQFPKNQLPADQTAPDSTVAPQATDQKLFAVFHTVLKGDTLWSIAQRYNTTVDKISELNELTNNIIRIGMRLRIR